MALDRKISISALCLIALSEVGIFLSFHSWNKQILLSLLVLAVSIPAWAACSKIKHLLEKEKQWKDYSIKLEKSIEQLEVQQTKYQYKEMEMIKLLQNMNTFVFSFDPREHKWFMSKKFQEFAENGVQDLQLGIRVIEDKIHPEDIKQFIKRKNEWLSGIPVAVDFRMVLPDGQIRWNELQTSSTKDSAGELDRIFGMIIDVTDRKERETQLAQMAYYDTLTELPNRSMLKSHLQKALSRAKRKEHEVTIMFIDLDGFKNVNDTLGHDTGDNLLKEVANRLNDSVREEDLISRLGGDEFIIVFEETSKKEITMIADRILQSISTPCVIEDNNVSVTPSIGISMFPEDGDDIESLVRNADKAMYSAKNNGKGRFQFYTPDLDEYQPKESLIDKILKMFNK